VVLGVQDKETAAYLGLAVAILVGLGVIHNQGKIESATNGNQSRLIGLMEAMMVQLRQLPPIPPEPPTASPTNGAQDTPAVVDTNPPTG
jgi:hypothetical protein